VKDPEENINRILTCAASILEDAGVEGFNTNEISKRSGVTIGAIYHHFANKEAIVRELCVRWLNRVIERYEEFEKYEMEGLDRSSFWLRLLERLYCAYKETVGLSAITRATEIWPNIRALEIQYDELVVTRVSRYLLVLGVEVDGREKRRIAILILNMMHYCLMLAASGTSAEAKANMEDMAGCLEELTRRHQKT
jgi:AcrR family transcriptional regulator